MLNAVSPACPVERMASEPRGWSIAVLRDIGKPDAVVGQHRVDIVGTAAISISSKSNRSGGGALDQLDEGEPGGPVDRDVEVEFAFGGLHLSQVDVKNSRLRRP